MAVDTVLDTGAETDRMSQSIGSQTPEEGDAPAQVIVVER